MSTIKLNVQPIDAHFVLKDKIYDAMKQAITEMNIYAEEGEPRLDERQLSLELGVSRTPIREAIARLEQEGLVRTVPRKGVFVVRKSKAEILEMIMVWAALESMAARLVTQRASDAEIATLRAMFTDFTDGGVDARIDEYSDYNIKFHQAVLRMSRSALLWQMAENLFIHMRAIRRKTISEDHRAQRSIIDHLNIIQALERRDTELAERLVRQHTLDLAAHVEKNVHYLD
jgi:DNA-binding GntR family transcriptional regulator